MKEAGTFRLYWQTAAGYRRLYLVGAIALLIVDLLDLLPALMVGLLVDTVQGKHPELTPLILGAGLIGIIFVQNVFRYPMRMYFRAIAPRVLAGLRERYAAHLMRVPQEFYTAQSTGDLMSRASNDMEAVERAMGIGFLIFFDTFYYLLTIPVVMVWISPRLALYAFALMPLVPVFVYFVSRAIDRIFGETQDIFGEMSAKSQQNAAGVHVVRAYGAEEAEIRSFGRISDRFVSRSLTLAHLEALLWPMISIILSMGMFAVLYFGGAKAIADEITIGEFFIFVQYMLMLIWPLMALGWTITLLQRGKASLRRINAVIDTPPAFADGPSPLEAVRGDIEFRRLTFQYPGTHEPALQEVSLRIKPGEALAVVGPVGSGKSTLVDLLTRMANPPPGTVFIDGRDVRDFKLADLRRQCAVAPQETFLFADTIRRNVETGALARQAGDVERAVERSRLSQDAFPDGMESMLGEKGINLSGGQKQRVALARAFVREAPILILDDAFSMVDAETEEAIMRNLREVRKRRTCLIISHRVRTAREADRIAVLDGGALAELGTHEQLMAKNGVYADLVREQSWGAIFNG